MMVHGRVTFCRIAVASCSAAFWSRYSLTNFTEFLFQSAYLFEVLEDALGLVFVDHADGESNVNQNIFADFSLGSVGEIDFFANTAEVDLGAAKGNVAGVHDFYHLAWNCKTHERSSAKTVSMFQSFKVSSHRGLAQRDAAIVRRHLAVRVHRESAGFKNRCGSLRQIAILKNSAAQNDLLEPRLLSHLQNPCHKRVVEPRGNSRNSDPCLRVFHDGSDQRSPVPVSQRIPLFGAQRADFVFQQHRRLPFESILLRDAGDRGHGVKEASHARSRNNVDAALEHMANLRILQ